MRICFCLGKLSFSGAENVARYLMERFIRDGYEVGVLLLNNMPESKEMIPGLVLLDGIVNEAGAVGTLKRVFKERTVLKEFAPDVFIVFNCEMAFSALPATLGMKKMKTVVCERNAPTVIPSSLRRRKLRDLLYRFATAGVYQTEAIAEYFEGITPRIFVINNPIREKGIKCAPCDQRKKVFTTVARLDDKQKNQSMMIRCFAKTSERYPEYELHLLGEGPDRAKYEELIRSLHAEDRIKLLGNQSRPINYIRECRAFLLTSEFEGMPNALIEAMSVGLPCITTDCEGGGAAALVQNHINGVLIERGDEDALFCHVCEFMENDELCDQLGDSAYQINEILDGDVIYEKWKNMIKSI